MPSSLEPTLAAPGAGLPKVELFVARLLFGMGRLTGDRRSFETRFRKERELIGKLVLSCDPESGARRVLIERLPGLEDSSRFWSVWMTLDHLRIVHHEMARVIGALAKGVVPDGEASTAAVKPDPGVTVAVVPEYEESCDRLLVVVAEVPDLKTSVRFAHPWFGPLDAAGWQALAAVHMGIHRAQIERILRGLTAT